MTNDHHAELKVIDGGIDNPNSHHCSPLPSSQLATAKQSFATRNAPVDVMRNLLTGDLRPLAGDLVLARVDRVRQHARIELINGRRCRMFAGDLVIVTYGNRYATDQFESLVPDHIGPCDLVAGGGIASQMRCRSPKVKMPTRIVPLGLIADREGQRLNLRQFQLNRPQSRPGAVPLFMVAGTAMNAGKTTTAAHLIKGLKSDGLKVGAIKVTGTGSGCDLWHFNDAGADCAFDFSDVGLASTYRCSTSEIVDVFVDLVSITQDHGVDVIVCEVADGLYQQETAALFASPTVKAASSGVFFAACDSLAAVAGDKLLRGQGYEVIGISGVVSASQLVREELAMVTKTPVLMKKQISSPGFGLQLLDERCCVLPQAESL